MYDYSKLLGRIKELGYTQETLAKEIGKNKSTLNSKLKGRFPFSADEIDAICRALDIPNEEVGAYFFCKKSLETQT